MFWLTSLILPLAVEIIKNYILSTDSKKDDAVLEVVKEGCTYLSAKDNNTLTVDTAAAVKLSKIDEKKGLKNVNNL